MELGLKHNQLAIGIGVQGLADLFIKMKYLYDSEEAIELNIKIHETIYYSALEASCELAVKYGPYKTYSNSPASKGVCELNYKYLLFLYYQQIVNNFVSLSYCNLICGMSNLLIYGIGIALKRKFQNMDYEIL